MLDELEDGCRHTAFGAPTRGSATMKKVYQSPKLVVLGSVADLTKTGLTQAGGDAKTGSVSSRGR
jgi:hypothetical protein